MAVRDSSRLVHVSEIECGFSLRFLPTPGVPGNPEAVMRVMGHELAPQLKLHRQPLFILYDLAISLKKHTYFYVVAWTQ